MKGVSTAPGMAQIRRSLRLYLPPSPLFEGSEFNPARVEKNVRLCTRQIPNYVTEFPHPPLDTPPLFSQFTSHPPGGGGKKLLTFSALTDSTVSRSQLHDAQPAGRSTVSGDASEVVSGRSPRWGLSIRQCHSGVVGGDCGAGEYEGGGLSMSGICSRVALGPVFIFS